jgi:hypothetical protein
MFGSIITAITVAAMLNTAENQTIGAEINNEITVTKVIKKANALTDVKNLVEFNTINLNLDVNVMIVAGNETDVIFDGDIEIADLIDLKIEGNTLDISAKEDKKAEFHNKTEGEKFTIIITVKELKGIVINGNGDIQCHDLVNTDNLDIEINGSGQVHTKSIDISVPAETAASKTTAVNTL